MKYVMVRVNPTVTKDVPDYESCWSIGESVDGRINVQIWQVPVVYK